MNTASAVWYGMTGEAVRHADTIFSSLTEMTFMGKPQAGRYFDDRFSAGSKHRRTRWSSQAWHGCGPARVHRAVDLKFHPEHSLGSEFPYPEWEIRGRAAARLLGMWLEPSWLQFVLILCLAQYLSTSTPVGQHTYLTFAQLWADASSAVQLQSC